MNPEINANDANHKKKSTVYLGLGTNLGEKQKNIESALQLIEEQIGNIISLSAFYLSKPVGFESENLFVNCVIKLGTLLTPHQILKKAKEIEKEMGRKQRSISDAYSDRIIDIDILLFENSVIDDPPKLTIPHARMHERDFVLKPLAEIAPHVVHPVLKKSITELLKEL